MIINISRGTTFDSCQMKAKYWYELGLKSKREADPLVFGGAIHKAYAHFFSTQDVQGAKDALESEVRERIENVFLLPEEKAHYEKMIEQGKCAVEQYSQHYSKQPFTVLHPEVRFTVALPGTEHHCWYAHKLLYPDVPFERHIMGDGGPEPHSCWQPHYLTGVTDAVIMWDQMVWLLEHKTTAYMSDDYFLQWVLDHQPTGYIYGIWKAIGLRPHGFILNVIKKPPKNARDQFAFGFSREPFLKTDEDLQDFEREMIILANDYERVAAGNLWRKNPKSCRSYNRTCYFHDLCKRFGVVEPGEFDQRDQDYVEEQYYTLLNIPNPHAKEKPIVTDAGADASN